MKVAIAIFVRTPTISPVKIKLAENIGKNNAEKFYFSCVNSLEHKILELNKLTEDIHPYWAIAEQEGLSSPMWNGMNKIFTGEGDLGQRMHHVYSTLRVGYDYILLMGVDSPQIPKEIILQAIDDMADNDYVVGTTQKNGIYLFGGKKSVTANEFGQICYNADNAEKVLSKNNNKVAYLQKYTEVDDITDLEDFQKEIKDNHLDAPLTTLSNIVSDITKGSKSKSDSLVEG